MIITTKTLSAQVALHKVWDNGRVVPSVCLLGVGWLCALLSISVSEGSANGLGPANLAPGIEEVLTRKNVIWCKLTKIILSGELAGEKRRSKTDPRLRCTRGLEINVCTCEIARGLDLCTP